MRMSGLGSRRLEWALIAVDAASWTLGPPTPRMDSGAQLGVPRPPSYPPHHSQPWGTRDSSMASQSVFIFMTKMAEMSAEIKHHFIFDHT